MKEEKKETLQVQSEVLGKKFSSEEKGLYWLNI